MNTKPVYRWPTNAAVERRYIVRDDHGRIGVAKEDNVYHPGTLFAHPVEMAATMPSGTVRGSEALPAHAILMTDTVWDWNEQLQAYTGWWVDDPVPTFPATVPPEMIRRLSIIDDMGYTMPDDQANLLLAGSDDNGHWNQFWAEYFARKGGSTTSEAKAAAARANGKKGGRPKKQNDPKDNPA